MFSQVYECFNVPVIDQCLLLNGEYLRSNDCTLWKLNISPGSLIFLKVGLASHTRFNLMDIFLFRWRSTSPYHSAAMLETTRNIFLKRDSRVPASQANDM